MNIFEKLLLMKEIRFEPGVITLLNNRSVMNSISLPVGMTIFLDNRPDLIPAVYQAIKKTHESGWGKVISEKYKMKPVDYLNQMLEMTNLAGWGRTELISFDDSKTEGVFRTWRAPVAEALKGTVKYPTEHLWRGMAAGTEHAIFDKDMDLIETKCFALGADYCEYRFFPTAQIDSETKKKYGYQLGDRS